MKDKDLEKAQAENDNLKRKLLAAEQKAPLSPLDTFLDHLYSIFSS